MEEFKCGSNIFTVIELAKSRRCLIFEPYINDLIEGSDLLGIKLPTKLRVRQMAKMRYFVQFDASAFFDQFPLSPEVIADAS